MFGGNRSNFMGSGLVAGDGMGPNIDLTGIDQSRLPMPTDGPRMPDALAAPQLQTMAMPQMPSQMPQGAPQMGDGIRPTGARRIAGLLSSFASGALGQPDRYGNMIAQRQQEQRQLQLQQQQQAEQRAYDESQWRARTDYQRQNAAPSQFDDNAGNRWQVGPDGNATLLFRDPNPRYTYMQMDDGSGNIVNRAVETPNAVPMTARPGMSYGQLIGGGTATPQSNSPAPSAPTSSASGLRPLPESQAATLRASLGEQGFQNYLQTQGFMVVPDGSNPTSPQDAVAAEMRRRGLM